MKNIQLVYLSENGREAIVLDTEELSRKELKQEYDMEVVDMQPLPSEGDYSMWPTDMLLERT